MKYRMRQVQFPLLTVACVVVSCCLYPNNLKHREFGKGGALHLGRALEDGKGAPVHTQAGCSPSPKNKEPTSTKTDSSSCLSITGNQETGSSKYQIPYLLRSQEFIASWELYEKHYKKGGKHDFEILEQMALILMEEGARSQDLEKRLIALYGCSIAGSSSALDFLELSLKSPQPEMQMVAIQLLAQLQDDRTETLLTQAMTSAYLPVRLEAAHLLAARKSPTALGQIEALMYRLPPELYVYFPPYFALIGTPDAIAVLRTLMTDRLLHTKVEAILSAARYGRDDLLPLIRTSLSHSNPAEQEACAAAIGLLRDSFSMGHLQRLKRAGTTEVKLSALKALHDLGDEQAHLSILELAKEQNLFAIALLGEISGSEEILASLLDAKNLQVRMNAAIALAGRHDPRCAATLLQLLVRDGRDLGLQPHFSAGKSLMSWKVKPSVTEHAKADRYQDLKALNLAIREHLLQLCLELPEVEFLKIAETIFRSGQTELIPSLTRLLENLQSEQASSLLQRGAQKAGAPLTRAYCNLACYRLHLPGPYEEALFSWIEKKKHTELIRFRPLNAQRLPFVSSVFELTPEESSRLLIESYQALAERHEAKSIDLLLTALKEGNPKNRPALAGLLLHALQ